MLREAVTSLQAAVLPADFPAVPGLDTDALYRSASEVAQVGGDFYDLFALEDGRVAAVIGDVCGKGVAAARHTVRLRYELRTLLEEDRPPGRVLAAFNRRVHAFYVSIGTTENTQGARAFHAALDAHGIKHTYYESEGTAHEWQTWRRSFHGFAPLLFQERGQ